MNQLYKEFVSRLSKQIDKRLISTLPIERLAWGTDASFYREIPRVVIFPNTVEDVISIVTLAYSLNVPFTFRAAGTSLSGQSISSSVLIVVGKKWDSYRIGAKAKTISLQCGIVGERVNEILKPFGKKFSPDPASLKSAMVGGIIMNNASGMNCGTHANSNKIIQSAKIILPDGFYLDTANEASRRAFEASHPHFCKELLSIREEILSNSSLKQHIQYKYSIKNVTGLNILPFIEYSNPFDIITHLLVGSEGTLAFLEEATVTTEDIAAYRASSMVYFSTIEEACKAIQRLKGEPIIGAELLDRKALKSVEDKSGMPEFLKTLPNATAAVLFETKASTEQELHANIEKIKRIVEKFDTIAPAEFLENESDYSRLWSIRSGVFPSVGGMRPVGTTCLIEDVAFHIEDLPQATLDLQNLIAKYGYDDGVIYGHALEGNYHFILNQRFDSKNEQDRYESMMNELVHLVVDKYNGSLKAEHGTGRNMAPFVEYEWGKEAFGIMKRVKQLFDPKGILNPGVIFNEDPSCFIKNIKPLTVTNIHVDKCIECGFCEVNCLSNGFTLSSRQRIVVQREIARLREEGKHPQMLANLEKGYKYLGDATCAGDGLCSTSCPMGINVAHLTHDIRQSHTPTNSLTYKAGNFAANHIAGIKSTLRPILTGADLAHSILGSKTMSTIAKGLHKTLSIPLWVPSMPKQNKVSTVQQESSKRKVVYFPSCINQTMGVAKNDPCQTSLPNIMLSLLHKAGFEVIYPTNMESLCCGMIWESKGMPDIADRKTKELEEALWNASEKGLYPVLCDQSPCLYRMRSCISSMKLFEPAEFIEKYLVDHLEFEPTNEPVALHVTCSTTKMQLKPTMVRLAKRCSTNVFVPEEIGCCGFAGDRGFLYPEVNAYALRKLRPQLELKKIKAGYSNSRTCEIGLSTNGGIPYQSIVYLVDKVTRPKKKSLESL